MKSKAHLVALFIRSGSRPDQRRAVATGGPFSDIDGRGARSVRLRPPGRAVSAAALAACCAAVLSAFVPNASADITHFREPQASFPFEHNHSPDGLGLDQTNHFVYIATQRNTILKYDAFGQPANFSSTSSPSIESQQYLQKLTVDGSGNIYVVSGGIPGAVYKYLPSGEADPTTPTIGSSVLEVPEGVAVNPSTGNVYVTNGTASQQSFGHGNPKIDEFSPTGTLENSFGSTPFSELNPHDIAIDSAGTVYVAAGSGGGDTGPFGGFVPKEGGVFVFKEDGTCLNSCNPLIKGDPLSVAVEPGTDRLYADMEVRRNGEEPPGPARDIITMFSSLASGNSELGSFTAADLENNAPNMAIDGSSGRVYVGDLYGGTNEEGHVAVFGPTVVVPTLTTTPVSNTQQTSVTLNGTVNTAGTGPETALTDCHFEYVTETAWKETKFTNLSSGGEVPCEPAAASIPNDEAPHAVSGNVSGLTPATAYRFRLAAANENDEGERARTMDGEPFTTAAPPRIDVEGAEQVKPSAATLHAKINPFVFDTTAYFEYISQADYQANGNSFSGGHAASTSPVEDLGGGVGDKLLEQTISGLLPETTYHYRVVATNAAGTVDGPDRTFTALPPAMINVLMPTEITPTEAKLGVDVNPEGLSTSFHFEYGTTQSYDQATSAAPAGSGTEATEGSARITGLQPNTTYHFHTVATNTLGTAQGPDSTFTTPPSSCPNEKFRTGYSARLPDCRAYEQISPIEKLGNPAYVLLVAPSGERAAVQQAGAGLPGAESVSVFNTDLAERTANGWVTHGVDPPARTGKFPALTLATNTELTEFAGKVDYANNIANINLSTSGAVSLRNAAGELIEFPVESVEGGPLGGDPFIVGASSDMSHLLFSSGTKLLPSDPQPSGSTRWYELTGLGGPSPSLTLASLENDGSPLSESPKTCSVFGLSTDYEIGSPMSRDGSKIFFEQPRKTNGGVCHATFLARVNGSKTVLLTEPTPNAECTISACQNSYGEPAGATAASADGSKFFFEDPQMLTDNATEIDSGPRYDPIRERFVTDAGSAETICKEVEWQTLRRVNGCNLYEYDFNRPEGHNLIDVTAERDTSGYGPQVHDVIGASADGSHVYFVSGGVLTPQPNALGQAAVPSAMNVYGYDSETGVVKFVAQVCSHRAEVPGGSSGPFGEIISGVPPDPKCHGTGEDESTQSIEFSRLRYHSAISADGRFMAFAAYPELTPDDTNEARDVYRYDFETGSLIRLSAGHHGEDNNGNAGGQDADVHAGGFLLSGPAPSAISNDGQTVAFTTSRQLQSTDTSGNTEIYVWHQGEVSLLSGGEDGIESKVPSVTPSGRDIIFNTSQGLLPQDNDHIYDAYDARIGGGFPEPPPPAQECESNERCHELGTEEPQAPTLGTETFRGSPNPTPQHKTCKPGFVKAHGKCVRTRHRKHHKRTKARSHKRAAGAHRGGAK